MFVSSNMSEEPMAFTDLHLEVTQQEVWPMVKDHGATLAQDVENTNFSQMQEGK